MSFMVTKTYSSSNTAQMILPGQHIAEFEAQLRERDATNNQAERQLRPAVITRKTTACNRTDEGAETHAILSSVLATCHQRNGAILDFPTELQRALGNPPSLIPPQPAPT